MKSNLSAIEIGKSKVSEVLPCLNIVAEQWNLKLSNSKHFKIARKILNNSVSKN
jgi:hypothetical protein